jgi:glutamate/tyrosine decarboxylase-like PLP-dependent enzyme
MKFKLSRRTVCHHESESQHSDIGKLSIQCGRRVDSLKFWLSWKYYSSRGYQLRIDNLFKVADYFAQRVVDDIRL